MATHRFSPSTSGSKDSDETAPKADCINVYVLDHNLEKYVTNWAGVCCNWLVKDGDIMIIILMYKKYFVRCWHIRSYPPFHGILPNQHQNYCIFGHGRPLCLTEVILACNLNGRTPQREGLDIISSPWNRGDNRFTSLPTVQGKDSALQEHEMSFTTYTKLVGVFYRIGKS